jgi:O-antigen/teichoic acid export membrane protein
MTKLRKSIAISFAEKYLTFGLQFAVSVILARLITPEDFGIFGVTYAIVGFAQAFRDMGVSNYLIQEREVTSRKIRAALFVSIAVAWLVALVIFLISPLIERAYGPQVGGATLVLLLNVLISPLGSTIMATLMREMNFLALLKINLTAAIANAVVAISLAVDGQGFMALVWGSVAGQVAIVAVAAVLRPERDHFLPSYRGIRGILRFGTIATMAAVLQQFSHNVANLITAKFVPLHDLGLFNRGQSVTGLFSRLLMDAIYPVVLPQLSQMRRDDADIGEGVLRAISYLAVVSWPFFLFLSIFADPLVEILLGDQWAGTADLLHIMALAGIFWIIAPIANPLLIASGKIQLTLHAQLINQPIAVLGVLFAASQGIEAVAIAAIPISAIHAVVWAYYLNRVVPIDGGHVLRTARGPVLVTIAAAASGLAARWATGNLGAFTHLAAGASATGLAWLIAVFAVRHPLAGELQTMALAAANRFRKRPRPA